MVNLLVRTPTGGVPVRVMQRALGGDLPVQLGINGNGVPETPQPKGLIDRFLERRPFYIAHRLGGQDFPEHTLQGLQASIGAGYKAVEFSTYQTRDGVFIGSHDWTTQRTTGVKHEIWNTDWATIQTLNQAAGKIIRIEQMVEALPNDVIVFLDHKATSAKTEPTQDGIRSETALFDLLGELFPSPQKRVVWKCFAEASSAERAKERGYKVNCMLYPSTLEGANLDRWDILGMEWNAQQEIWNRLKATGKPTLAHIIYNQTQAQAALGRGADGLMSSVPTTVYP